MVHCHSNSHSSLCCLASSTLQQGQKDFAIILAKIRDTAIFNRLYIKLYIKFVANNGKNRDSVHAAISFCPCPTVIFVITNSSQINYTFQQCLMKVTKTSSSSSDKLSAV